MIKYTSIIPRKEISVVLNYAFTNVINFDVSHYCIEILTCIIDNSM